MKWRWVRINWDGFATTLPPPTPLERVILDYAKALKANIESQTPLFVRLRSRA